MRIEFLVIFLYRVRDVYLDYFLNRVCNVSIYSMYLLIMLVLVHFKYHFWVFSLYRVFIMIPYCKSI